MSKLSLLHFNDVYRVSAQKLSSRSPETIDVTQFAALLHDLRDSWSDSEGLILFSGDVFSPSIESTVTRGSHMVPVLNELGIDVSLTGNHDFDFGYPHLTKLIQDTKFPWILSNIIDNTTSKVPEHLHEYQVFERAGIRIGIIGLVEKAWIGTVSSWPPNFEYREMEQVGIELSKRLRDPNGEAKCDLIIALTHSRVPNDILLARALLALSPSAQVSNPIEASHGVDVVLGGHDHIYFASRGVDSWKGFDTTQHTLGAEEDRGDVLVVKSGTDFRDLSEIVLELEDSPPGNNVVRKKLIKKITGERHSIKPNFKSSARLRSILSSVLDTVSSSLKAPVAISEVELDLRSEYIRTAESASGNWFADILRHSYDDVLCMKGCGGADAVFISAGTLRGDSTYGPGNITLGDILEILPFEDPLVVLELDGESLWATLEAGLETWPAQEGRFPVISGFRVTWDSRRPPGQRILSIYLDTELADSSTQSDSGQATPQEYSGLYEEVKREKGGRKYKVVTREYMAQGHDGFVALKDGKYLIDDESGQMMSTIVRKYLLGSRFVNRMTHLVDSNNELPFIQPDTEVIVHRELIRKNRYQNRAKLNWKHAAALAIRWIRSKRHYRDNMSIVQNEHMSGVDCINGEKMRGGFKETGAEGQQGQNSGSQDDEDLLQIHPVVDGRFKNVGRDA